MSNFSNALKTEKVTIAGAGLVGSLLSIYLAKRGISSVAYERRSDPRKDPTGFRGRSINLAISTRGLHALSEVGLEKEALLEAVPMYGRMIHPLKGELNFQRYSHRETDCIYSISRTRLNEILLTAAEKTGKVDLQFNQRISQWNCSEKTIYLENEEKQMTRVNLEGPIFGTDGSASVMRSAIQDQWGKPHQEESPGYGYKELHIPPTPNGEFQMEANALHIWPRGQFMLIALPNHDRSFTCTLFLPYQGAHGFQHLQTQSDVQDFFAEQFPDALKLIPNVAELFLANPTGHLVTIRCADWHLQDKAVLLGDAAHAILPFFGQGMNCGFEDCSVLNGLMDTCDQWETLFATFQEERKENSNAIADMAIENFAEMREKVGKSDFLFQKSVEKILQDRFPEHFHSRYSLVTFSRKPYTVAYQVGRVIDAMVQELASNLKDPSEINLVKAEQLIQTRLNPLLN